MVPVVLSLGTLPGGGEVVSLALDPSDVVVHAVVAELQGHPRVLHLDRGGQGGICKRGTGEKLG